MSRNLFIGLILQMVLSFLLVSADGNAQLKGKSIDEIYLSLHINNVKIGKAFNQISKETGFTFAFNENLIDLNQLVSIDAKNKSLSEILLNLSKDSNLKFKRINSYIHVAKRVENESIDIEELTNQQSRTITGTVTSSDDNEGLPGVNVVVKGTSQGTVTDLEGNYSLEVPDQNAILVFSSVGFISEEVLVGNRSAIDLRLSVDVTALDEVVIVGYGSIRKDDLTGAVGSVTKDDLQQPTFNIMQRLRGKVAGVNIFNNSGSPTGRSRVVIRGVGTINASPNPLYVVDGVAMENIDFINPNDITNMEVLKDASAAAIYGSRGANGVVIITTERGVEDGFRVGYNLDLSVGTLRKRMDTQNSEEFMEMIKIGFDNAPKFRDYAPGTEPVLDLSDERLFDAQGNPLYDTDWQREATRNAFSQDHQLSIQYGNDKASMGAFINYSDRQGILLNSWMKRLSVKFAFDAKLSKRLTVGAVFTTSSIKENEVTEDFGNYGGPPGDPLKKIGSFTPIFPVKWPDGTWTNQTQQTKLPRLNGFANPVHELLESDKLRDRALLFGNAYVAYQLLPSLEFRSQLGIDNTDYEAYNYGPKDMIGVGFPDGIASIQNSSANYWQSENYFTFLKEFDVHRINAVLGASWQQREFYSSSIQARGFPNDFYKYNALQSATTILPPQSIATDWSLASYFVRFNYSYKDKYAATISNRIDGSSRFGEDNKYGYFPSAGASWMLSNEDFMSGVNFIDRLKLRTSYGVNGNTEIGVYQSLATLNQGTTLINGALQASSYIQRLPNPNLKWEKTKQFNIGTELSLFNYRLSLEVDYYYKLTEDLLFERPVPSSTGFNTIMDNIGSVSNKGFDVLLTTRNVVAPKFTWNTTLNFNYNKNRVESLGANDEDIFPGPRFYGVSNTILRVGEPIGSFWGLQRLGTWGTDEADEAAKVGRLPGMNKRTTERTIIGKGYPDFSGSFINNFTFGNFDLTVDIQFVYGVEVLQQYFHVHDERMGIEPMFRKVFYNAWTEENQDTRWPQIRHLRLSGSDATPDDSWVADGSYIRGNLISLGYTFNKNALKPIGLSLLRLIMSVENAFVIHSEDFMGFDPESTSSGSSIHTQNIFTFSYPKPTTYTFGLRAQF